MSNTSTLGTISSTFTALDTQLQTIAANLALSRVNASNEFVANFEIASVENMKLAGTVASESNGNNSVGVNIVKGIKLAGLYQVVAQGAQKQTSNPLDVMINGPGYAVVDVAFGNGKAYTRDLRFTRSATGILMKGPYVVDPSITIPVDARDITISANGEVQALLPGQIAPTTLGQLTIVTFNNPNGLTPTKDNLFLESGPTGSGAPIQGIAGTDGYGSFVQHALEESTINPTDQLLKMVEVTKIYGYLTSLMEREDEKEKQLARAA